MPAKPDPQENVKMRNIEVYVKDGTLLLKVDLSLPGMLSQSGKNTVVATTAGNMQVPGAPDFAVNCNVFRYTRPDDPPHTRMKVGGEQRDKSLDPQAGEKADPARCETSLVRQ